MRRRHLPLLALLAVAIAAFAAGCGSKKEAATTVAAVNGTTTAVDTTDLLEGQTPPSIYNDASLFALHADDVPTGYVVDRDNTRAVTNADSAKGRGDEYLRQLESWGRITGYATGWLPSGDSAQNDPVQIQSSGSTFETEGGAIDAFAQGVKEADKLQVEKTDMPDTVGDESRMWIAKLGESTAGQKPLTIYEIAWRSGRVLATLAVATRGGASKDDALALANTQQERIDRIVSGKEKP